LYRGKQFEPQESEKDSGRLGGRGSVNNTSFGFDGGLGLKGFVGGGGVGGLTSSPSTEVVKTGKAIAANKKPRGVGGPGGDNANWTKKKGKFWG